jgi:hypothetical protein
MSMRDITVPTATEAAPAGRWPGHLHPGALRWMRSSTHYDATIAFYRDLVGLPVIGSFQDSYGEDGTIFGLPDTAIHMEIVRSPGRGTGADRYDQLVFYLPDHAALTAAVEPLRHAGVTPAPDAIPYWVANGALTFLDPDGRGVVYASWTFGREPDPVDRAAAPARPAPQDRSVG